MYKIIKRIMDGIDIIGYVVYDDDGNEKSLKEEDIIRLCHRKLVLNASTVMVDDKEHLIIEDNLEDMESIKKAKVKNTLKLICRLVSTEDNKVVCKGYIAKDDAGKKFRLDTVKAWKLAKENCIENIEAKIVNKKKILISNNGLLERLPVMDA